MTMVSRLRAHRIMRMAGAGAAPLLEEGDLGSHWQCVGSVTVTETSSSQRYVTVAKCIIG